MNIEIEFEHECYKCYGTSAWMSDKQCDCCDNKGKVPTELGDALLEFLKRQGFKPATGAKEKLFEGVKTDAD